MPFIVDMQTETLRQNDPAITNIRIRLRDETSDVDLASALEQNPFVVSITFNLAGEQRGPDFWKSLLRVIAVCGTNWERVTLAGRPLSAGAAVTLPPPDLVRAFLRAIQQNTAVKCVRLIELPVSSG